jgi:hypothetical protein
MKTGKNLQKKIEDALLKEDLDELLKCASPCLWDGPYQTESVFVGKDYVKQFKKLLLGEKVRIIKKYQIENNQIWLITNKMGALVLQKNELGWEWVGICYVDKYVTPGKLIE